MDLAHMTGLEILLAIKSGEIPAPPAHELIGITAEHFGIGLARFSMLTRPEHYNIIGGIHGGIIASILDAAAGCAVQSSLRAGVTYTTLDLHVTYVRTATLDSGLLRAEGHALHVGRKMGTAEAKLVDDGGRLIAHAVCTCIVLPR